MAKTNCFLKAFVLLFFFGNYTFCLAQVSKVNNGIRGNIKVDSTWSSKIYLSAIPSFDKMFTMSNAMILSVSNIDDGGDFFIDTSFLPNEERFYRIHIAKKNAPPASLIIGGKDENHLFIIANRNSNIELRKESITDPISRVHFINNSENEAISRINSIARLVDSAGIKETYLKREFITKGIQEELRFIADTASNNLVSLYALYKSRYESNYPINQQFYKDYIEKWSTTTSSYFTQFKNSLPIKNEKQPYSHIIIGILCFTLGVLGGYYIWVFRKSSKLKSLSLQERKIFYLLKEGKTNKEISEDLNIGISTVKSHASNIYSKLNINSRKDIVDI